jgi:CheY-like chemotaxis protein
MSGEKIKTNKGKKKVLIIDDDREFTNLLNSALELHGDYEVCVENNPRQAVAAARKFVPDIIILDVVMPEASGGEVHAQFKADSVLKDIPIIFLTSIVEQKEVDKRGGVIGGLYYVAKPVSAGKLLRVIAEHLQP